MYRGQGFGSAPASLYGGVQMEYEGEVEIWELWAAEEGYYDEYLED